VRKGSSSLAFAQDDGSKERAARYFRGVLCESFGEAAFDLHVTELSRDEIVQARIDSVARRSTATTGGCVIPKPHANGPLASAQDDGVLRSRHLLSSSIEGTALYFPV
jgi:hypothetical protein